MIGKTLGHYEIKDRLGRGGMGEVFLARDTRLGRDVALKILPPATAKNPERRARFEREARAVAALRHPGIVTIHSIEELDGVHFFTMERIEGRPLSDRIPATGMDLEPLLDFAIALTEAVGVAHASGITHRDLKPANVMVDADGRVKVLDFGLAKAVASETALAEAEGNEATQDELDLETAVANFAPGASGRADELTADGRIVGTVHYMSPEQAEGKPVDPRSDVFALGVLLYEMAVGERPFQGDTSISVLSAILKEEPRPLSGRVDGLPPALDQVVARCLAKSPAERYPDATALREALESVRTEYLANTGTSSQSVPIGKEMSGDVEGRRVSESGPGSGSDASSTSVTPQRSSRIPMVLGLIAGAIVLGLLPILLRRSDDSGSGTAIGASGRPSVAVFQFRTHGGDEEIRWLESGVPSLLLTGLAQTPGLDVVSSARIEEILEKIGRAGAKEVDQAILAEVARRSGAGAVVIGNIYKSGDSIRIDVQVEDVETGRLLFARDASGPEVFPIVDRLASGIREGLAVKTAQVDERSVAEISSQSIEAYREYEEGRKAFTEFRLGEAKRRFERALDLDSDFALALASMAEIYRYQGEVETANEWFERAHDLAVHLPTRERLLVEAEYQLRIEQDREAAVGTLEGLIDRFPDEEEAYLLLSSTEGQEGDSENAIRILAKAVEAIPNSGTLHNHYAYHLRSVGRFEDAIRELEKYQEIEPEEANPWDSMGEIYLTTGRPEEAIAKFSKAIEVDPTFESSHRGRAFALALLGRYPEALEELDRSVALITASGLSPRGLFGTRGLLLQMMGRPKEAFEEASKDDGGDERADLPGSSAERTAENGTALDSGFAESWIRMVHAFAAGEFEACVLASRRARETIAPMAPPFYQWAIRVMTLQFEGTAEARNKQVEAARAAQQRIVELGVHPFVPWAQVWLEGEIALAENDLAAAETAFRNGEPTEPVAFTNAQPGLTTSLVVNIPPSRDWNARLHILRGDLHAAVEEYRRLNTRDASSMFSSLFQPRYVLEVARLLDRQGDREGAVREYERFLQYWKDAEPGQPEVQEARDYLASGS